MTGCYGEIPTKIVAGAYWKNLPDTVVYEASIPLIYTDEETFKDNFCGQGPIYVLDAVGHLEANQPN